MWFVFQSQFRSRQKVVVEHFSIVRAECVELSNNIDRRKLEPKGRPLRPLCYSWMGKV